jgi:hypothetical protein
MRAALRRAAVFLLSAVVLTVAAPAQTKQAPVLTCSPTTLNQNSTLSLRFGLPHPAELAIEAPDGTFYFVAYDRNAGTPAGQSPLVDKASFRKMAELKLEVSKAEASPLVYGRNSNERIFRLPGKYKIVLADNIQSDDDSNVFRCQITLKLRP